MSMPISHNHELQDPVRYAPPHVRERTFREDRSEIAEAVAGCETTRSEAGQFKRNQAQTLKNEEGRTANGADALDWLDDAIRAVIELERACGATTTADAGGAGAQSPPLAPTQRESSDFPPVAARVRQTTQGGSRGVFAGSAHSVRPWRLHPDPVIVPEPPIASQEGGRFRHLLRFSLVIAFAAIVAYGLTTLSRSQSGALWLKGAASRVAAMGSRPKEVSAPPPPRAQLVVENQQAFANEPLSLGVNVEHATEDESLLLDGLARGTTLSAGQSTSPFSWQFPSNKLRGLYLYAPKDFVGVMNTTVNLLGSDDQLLDSRAMQLKWIAKEPTPRPAPAPALVTATAGEAVGTAKSSLPAVEPIDPGEIAILMQKGRDSLDAGDISGARVAFGRLADAGLADAALALATTYDPEYLAAHNFLGVRGDRAAARALYQRAKDMGSVQAGRILARMPVD